jgi:hypothetical protein
LDRRTRHLPFLLESPGPQALLPAASIGARPPSPELSRYLPVGRGVDPVLSPFQKAAQVSCLLHRVLRWDCDRSEALPAVASFAHLNEEIRTATHTLLQDAQDWEMELDCFSMCNS